MIKYKPCPFCGGTDIIGPDESGFWGPYCSTCHAVGPSVRITAKHRTDWNTRAGKADKPYSRDPVAKLRANVVNVLRDLKQLTSWISEAVAELEEAGE